MFDTDTKILVAEDTDITRAIVRKMLEKMNFKHVTEVPNGALAWQEIERSVTANSPYRIVIADWNMPEMNGIDLLKRMQMVPQLRSTSFILLTSNTEKDHVVEAIKSGVSIYLAKPFAASALERKIKEAYAFLNNRKAG
jgi:two-component system, chemotaxis family, chemotaxis protein CheY